MFAFTVHGRCDHSEPPVPLLCIDWITVQALNLLLSSVHQRGLPLSFMTLFIEAKYKLVSGVFPL